MFESLFNAMSGETDLEYALIDGTIVQAHQKAFGRKRGTQHQAIATLSRRTDDQASMALGRCAR